MASYPSEAEEASYRLQEAEDKVKLIYNQMLKEPYVDVDEIGGRSNCWVFYDRLKPSHPRPDFKINFRTGRNNPKTLKGELRAALVEEKKGEVSGKAGKVVDKFVEWINAEHVIMDGQTPAIDLLEKMRAPNCIKQRLIKLSSARQIKWDTDEVSSTAGNQDPLKQRHPCREFKINFRTGRADWKTLADELIVALDLSKDLYKRKIREFVLRINTTMDCHIFAMEILELLDAPQYMTERLIELSIAGQIRWETDDVDEVSEGDITNFSGTVTYGQRKLFEAGKLWRRVSSGDSEGVLYPRSLLPMMYWLKDKGEAEPTWAEWNPYRKDNKPKNTDPPLWAVNYIKEARAQGDILYSNMSRFQPTEKPFRGDDHKNAVYLLLCRFNGEGVPDEARVQAYAGKAKNGVEKRWMEHALASKNLMQLFSDLTKFSATPLQSVLLVDVLIGRLYAEGGRKYFTETETSHDNIALFVYKAYGKDAVGVKTNEKAMEKAEKDLIKDLQLTKMECGMNGRS
uniref:Uncharacterized protein n=1 Tax=Branchiostoma floridae TaxID=7739 RepID=C3Y5Y8_BRAFL|eukprot:XP_002608375.1 hypothetical protein BRAFLDRAFT_91334 [Branchiostoma floridae]